MLLSLLFVFSGCEKAYQEAKDERRLGEGVPSQPTESPIDSDAKQRDPSPIPVFGSEEMNAAIDEYAALSFRLDPSVGKPLSEAERQDLTRKRDRVLDKIEQLRAQLNAEESAVLDQFLKGNP